MVKDEIGKPWQLCLQKATATDGQVDVYLFNRLGERRDVQRAVPVDGFVRGLMALFGDTEEIDDEASQWMQRVKSAVGVLVVNSGAVNLRAGFDGSLDRNRPTYVQDFAGCIRPLLPGEAVSFGIVPQSAVDMAAPLGVVLRPVIQTTPTVANATSVEVAAVNPNREYLLIQNNTAGNIMLSLSGAVLTGIAPTSTNIGIVLVPGASYESARNCCPSGSITAYQTSGASVNTIVVTEG